MTDSEKLDELQGDLSDLRHGHICHSAVAVEIVEITESLDCAESCETLSDFDANIQSAIAAAKSLILKLKKLRGRA